MPPAEHTYSKASTICHILDYDMKVAKFQGVKKERQVNAFHQFLKDKILF